MIQLSLYKLPGERKSDKAIVCFIEVIKQALLQHCDFVGFNLR